MLNLLAVYSYLPYKVCMLACWAKDHLVVLCLYVVLIVSFTSKEPYSVYSAFVPFEKLELGAEADVETVVLKRLVVTLSVATFFWGWKRIMWTFGAKRHPRTTEPLRLTEMHMVVVCTWDEREHVCNDGYISLLFVFFFPIWSSKRLMKFIQRPPGPSSSLSHSLWSNHSYFHLFPVLVIYKP